MLRALTSGLGFLLLAFKPDSDTMAKELRELVGKSVQNLFNANFRAIYEQLELVTSDPERRRVIITAMKI